jgi:hypothetical protein
VAQSRRSPDEAVALLRHLTHLGAMSIAARQQWRANWTPVQRIIQAAREPLFLESERLHGLLQRSNALLTPLADPLLVDFGAHRWLAKAREEVYSDWLLWIVEQLQTPQRVFRLFGIDDPAGIALCQQTLVTVQREVVVPQGHDDQVGKLDLVVCYEGKALIVVEIKKTSADVADTRKQHGYMQWITAQPEPKAHKYPILLVVEVTQEDYEGFAPRRWASLCMVLRRIAQTLCKGPQHLILAAMILAFVGAVEQNLLAFSAPLLQRIHSGRSVRISSEIGNHLEASFEEEGAYGNA